MTGSAAADNEVSAAVQETYGSVWSPEGLLPAAARFVWSVTITVFVEFTRNSLCDLSDRDRQHRCKS